MQRKIAANALHTIGGIGDEPKLQALAETTGIEDEEVSRLVVAHKLGAETGIAPAVFFARGPG